MSARYALWTIDVESTHTDPPELQRQSVFGRIGEAQYGVPKIIDLLASHGQRGVFFVDYAMAYFNEPLLRETLECVVAAKHDVALHVHWNIVAKLRPELLSRKADVILAASEYFRCVTGRPLRAYRGGMYVVDDEIAEALIAHGIRLECSYFQMYKENCSFYRCAIDNAIVRYRGLLAIPVTTLPNRYHSKLDVNTRTASSLVEGIEALPVSVVFLHSMSLLKPWRGAERLSHVDADAVHNCLMALACVVTKRIVSLDIAGIEAREEELIKLTYSSEVDKRLKSIAGQRPAVS